MGTWAQSAGDNPFKFRDESGNLTASVQFDPPFTRLDRTQQLPPAAHPLSAIPPAVDSIPRRRVFHPPAASAEHQTVADEPGNPTPGRRHRHSPGGTHPGATSTSRAGPVPRRGSGCARPSVESTASLNLLNALVGPPQHAEQLPQRVSELLRGSDAAHAGIGADAAGSRTACGSMSRSISPWPPIEQYRLRQPAARNPR